MTLKPESGRRKYYRLICFQADAGLDVTICEAAKLQKISLSDFIREACMKAATDFLEPELRRISGRLEHPNAQVSQGGGNNDNQSKTQNY